MIAQRREEQKMNLHFVICPGDGNIRLKVLFILFDNSIVVNVCSLRRLLYTNVLKTNCRCRWSAKDINRRNV